MRDSEGKGRMMGLKEYGFTVISSRTGCKSCIAMEICVRIRGFDRVGKQ